MANLKRALFWMDVAGLAMVLGLFVTGRASALILVIGAIFGWHVVRDWSR